MSGLVTLEFEAALDAPPERVFASVTEGRHIERWFCDACESETHEDGRLTLRWTRPYSTPWPFEATWVEFDPPRRCAFRGGHQGYPNRDAGTVWFLVERAPEGSRFVVRQQIPDTPEYARAIADFRGAWPRALRRLAAYLAPPERSTP